MERADFSEDVPQGRQAASPLSHSCEGLAGALDWGVGLSEAHQSVTTLLLLSAGFSFVLLTRNDIHNSWPLLSADVSRVLLTRNDTQ